MQSANFSIPISAQICNISMNAATLHRIICPPTAKFKQEDLQNRKRTGKQGKEGPLCCLPTCKPCRLHTWQARWLGATFRLLGRFVPKPL